MTIRCTAAALLLAAVLAPPLSTPLPAQALAPEYRGATALGLQLRKVGVTKRVLMVGAHPDDEDTELLARFALEEGADAAYLSLTRGEGGQNGIGPELAEALGLLRTEELLAARRVDGAAQRFTRAYDFGYSRSAEETLRHWPREELLRDVVGVIRAYRPDVIVTVFRGTPRDGHGHHQVSAQVAMEAFHAAADPARFPDQVAAGLGPWRTAKLYRSLRGDPEGATVRIPVGTLDPLTGRSAFQLAMASRSRHRSQDMGSLELAGPRWGTLLRVIPAPAGEERSVWEGIDTVLAYPPVPGPATRGMHPVERVRTWYPGAVERVRRLANPADPDAVVGALTRVVAELSGEHGVRPEWPGAARWHRDVEGELGDARAALASAAGLVLDAIASDARVVPGQTFELEVQLWNGGARTVSVEALRPALPAGWTAEPAGDESAPRTLAPGTLASRRFRVRVPADAEPTEAYFLRAPREGAMYRWPAGVRHLGAPFHPGPVGAFAEVRIQGGDLNAFERQARLPLEAAATFRELDLRQGELRRPVDVVPAVSVLLEPRARVLSTAEPRPLPFAVRLEAEAPEGIAGTLRLRAPAGWRVEPAALPVRFAAPGEVREARFTVRAPEGASPGDHEVSAVFEAEDGRRFARGVQWVDYPHVRARPLLHEARAAVGAFDLRVPAGLRVAYVEGAGEEGPGFLANLGIAPTLLGPADLAEGDLDRFDAIVLGSRAYEVRHDLMAHNRRLLDWVERGGTLIVQYNKYELVEGGFAPYPLTMARPHGRVTDETAPVRLLDPAHPALSTPNRITAADFDGWVQERGLYFADTWAPEYTPLLETGDDGQALRGGLLVARHGRGTYVYTGLAFFRQLPEGVPGAYRLFANLLALGGW
jgi:LmbE family N-acetylglucosaminyl deacetylase